MPIYLLRAVASCAGAPAPAISVLVFVGRGFNPLRRSLAKIAGVIYCGGDLVQIRGGFARLRRRSDAGSRCGDDLKQRKKILAFLLFGYFAYFLRSNNCTKHVFCAILHSLPRGGLCRDS